MRSAATAARSRRAIEKSRQKPGTLSLPVTLTVAKDGLIVGVPDDAEAHGAVEVWICGIARAITVAIKRGENRGKTITYHNVARRWLKLEGWNGKAHTWTVPLQEFGAEGVDGAAVMVQTGTTERPSRSSAPPWRRCADAAAAIFDRVQSHRSIAAIARGASGASARALALTKKKGRRLTAGP